VAADLEEGLSKGEKKKEPAHLQSKGDADEAAQMYR